MIEPMLPIAMNSETVAVVLDENGQIIDECFNWQTAQNFAGANEVIAVSNDGSMTMQEIQSLCDYEREIFLDCFGN